MELEEAKKILKENDFLVEKSEHLTLDDETLKEKENTQIVLFIA